IGALLPTQLNEYLTSYNRTPLYFLTYTNPKKWDCDTDNTLVLESITTNPLAEEDEQPNFPETITIKNKTSLPKIFMIMTNQPHCPGGFTNSVQSWLEVLEKNHSDFKVVEVTSGEPILGSLGIESRVIAHEEWYNQDPYGQYIYGSCDEEICSCFLCLGCGFNGRFPHDPVPYFCPSCIVCFDGVYGDPLQPFSGPTRGCEYGGPQ